MFTVSLKKTDGFLFSFTVFNKSLLAPALEVTVLDFTKEVGIVPSKLYNFTEVDFKISRLDPDICDLQSVIDALYKQQVDIRRERDKHIAAGKRKAHGTGNSFNPKLDSFIAASVVLNTRIDNQIGSLLTFRLAHPKNLFSLIQEKESSKELLDYLNELLAIYNSSLFEDIYSKTFIQNVALLDRALYLATQHFE